jgi:hypothetical protein
VGPQGPIGPAGSQIWNTYVPLAAHSAVVAGTFTPANDITVTRIQAQAFVAPTGCSTNLALQLSDGTPAGTRTLLVSSAANDTGPFTFDFNAASVLRLTVVPPTGCDIPPASINVVVQYRSR